MGKGKRAAMLFHVKVTVPVSFMLDIHSDGYWYYLTLVFEYCVESKIPRLVQRALLFNLGHQFQIARNANEKSKGNTLPEKKFLKIGLQRIFLLAFYQIKPPVAYLLGPLTIRHNKCVRIICVNIILAFMKCRTLFYCILLSYFMTITRISEFLHLLLRKVVSSLNLIPVKNNFLLIQFLLKDAGMVPGYPDKSYFSIFFFSHPMFW